MSDLNFSEWWNINGGITDDKAIAKQAWNWQQTEIDALEISHKNLRELSEWEINRYKQKNERLEQSLADANDQIERQRERIAMLREAICIYCREETSEDWENDTQALEWFINKYSELNFG